MAPSKPPRSTGVPPGASSQVEQVGCDVRALSIKVTAPFKAHQVPLLLAAEFTAIEVYAKMFPCI